MHTLRLMTVSGPFRVLAEHEVKTTAEALAIVEPHATKHGLTNVKKQDDGDCCSLRFTATTPGGRAGRNIAFLDYGYDCDNG